MNEGQTISIKDIISGKYDPQTPEKKAEPYNPYISSKRGNIPSYSDLLKDPRWQKKRLQIMDRDEFKCRLCKDSETELQVHHKKYKGGKMPWEYQDSDLITLCKDCHRIYGNTKENQFDLVIERVRTVCISDVDGSKVKLYRYDNRGILMLITTGKVQQSYVFNDFSVDDIIQFLKNI